ncbi:MAG: chorismate synthase [Candidatus Hodarchaeales archaeon]|jgi:chorismate synthase
MNIFGNKFKIMTWGESHGKAIGVIIDGVPPGLDLSIEDIQKELDRRKPGQSEITTQRKEKDNVEILSGVFNGKTTGTPISLMIKNTDVNSSSYEEIKGIFRPGHSDYTYNIKYQGFSDYRGGGRSSGRETATRVAAGAIARKILKNTQNISIVGYVKQIGNIRIDKVNYDDIEKNPLRCPDMEVAREMEEFIKQIKDEGDSIGGIVEIIVKNSPPGIGDPVFGKLDAYLSYALMSIGAVKGVSIGEGFNVAKLKGSENNDMIDRKGFISNHAGGILGGISTGQDIIIQIAVKPTASIHKRQKTITKDGRETEIMIKGRHDPCICPRIVPVAEAMVALVLVDLIKT